VDKEMKAHMPSRIRDAKAALDRALKDAQNEVLTIEANVKNARELVSSTKTDLEIAEERLKAFYQRCNAVILNAGNVPSREVIDRYFAHKPPFAETGDKKAEFPDAYALLSLEKWAEENDFKVLVVSGDKGWRDFCADSNRLVYEENLGTALKILQPEDAAAQLMQDFNNALISNNDVNGVLEKITARIKDDVENLEIDVNADSRFYWEAEDVHAIYKKHEFFHLSETQVDLDLVKDTENHAVVRLIGQITCDIHASFALSMDDPIDKDQVSLGSQDHLVEEELVSEVLVTFEGDLARGLAGVTVKAVEVIDKMPTVEFGEIEMEWDRDAAEEFEDLTAPGEAVESEEPEDDED
jgi:hypothetical protein